VNNLQLLPQLQRKKEKFHQKNPLMIFESDEEKALLCQLFNEHFSLSKNTHSKHTKKK